MKNLILTIVVIMITSMVHAGNNPNTLTDSITKGNIITLAQSSYHNLYDAKSFSPDSGILTTEAQIGAPCTTAYDNCTAYCLEQANACTSDPTICAAQHQQCNLGCAGTESICVIIAFGGNPPVVAVPAFPLTVISGGGITIGTSYTVKIAQMTLSSGAVATYGSANSAITSISLTATGINSSNQYSSPISLGNATYNSMDGYYEYTISSTALNGLIGYNTIKLNADVANTYIPITQGVCDVPGHYPAVIVAPLLIPAP